MRSLTVGSADMAFLRIASNVTEAADGDNARTTAGASRPDGAALLAAICRAVRRNPRQANSTLPARLSERLIGGWTGAQRRRHLPYKEAFTAGSSPAGVLFSALEVSWPHAALVSAEDW